MVLYTLGVAFEKMSMDIVGPLPVTKAGNESILTIQDSLTKYSLDISLPNQQASTIADAFVKKFICIFGSPKGVLTDQGTDFLSNLLRRLAKCFCIRKFRTTAFHPQSNGSLERSHHVLAEYLKQFVTKNAEWDDWLKLAPFSYNTSVPEGTKCTPYELVSGRLARQPSSDPPLPHERLEIYGDCLMNLVTKLHDIQSLARKNLIGAKEKFKFYYDKKINPQNFKVGNNVFILKGARTNKLDDQYTGPHEVLEILGKGNVRIRVKKSSKVVQINRIRLGFRILSQSNKRLIFAEIKIKCI